MSKKTKNKDAKVAENKTELDVQVDLNIPDDEIWSYQIEGLAAPHINKPFKNANAKKAALVLIILVAVSLSMYFSIRSVVSRASLEFKENETGYTLTKYSNADATPVTELDLDFVFEIKDGKLIKDESKPITEIAAYALNCESTVKVINIGPDVEYIDAKAFYSCWALERIEVDENNSHYSDIDGVLYNKDQTVLMNYPCNHDQYLRVKYGYDIDKADKTDEENQKYAEPHRWTTTEEYSAQLGDSAVTIEQYRKEIQTYVVPSTVVTINDLAFAYTNLHEIYLPEGLKEIKTCGFFKLHEPASWGGNTPSLNNIYSYTAEGVTDTAFASAEALGEVYLSLPEGLEYIGSDAFSYNQEMSYLYIPSSVTFIGHHAFWDCVYKDNGTPKGVTQVNVALSEDDFDAVETGDQWRPQLDNGLFKKSVEIVYSVER